METRAGTATEQCQRDLRGMVLHSVDRAQDLNRLQKGEHSEMQRGKGNVEVRCVRKRGEAETGEQYLTGRHTEE